MHADVVAKQYAALDPHERFRLVVEAMARGDTIEEGRLDDACPRRVYRMDDRDYRLRMKASFTIAVTTCLNMREDLVLLRVSALLPTVLPEAGTLPARIAVEALRFGRSLGRYEQGGDPEHPDGEGEDDAEFAGYARELDEGMRLCLERTGKAMKQATGEELAPRVLGYWEGFARFCRDALGLEPVALLRAWGLGEADPTEVVRQAYPDAAPDETVAFARRRS